MITTDMVIAFWGFMQQMYGSRRVNKSDAVDMKLVADLLDSLGITDRDTFMSRFTTTILNTIYTPFNVGIPTPEFSLWDQVVICVHEHQHIIQSKRDGAVKFSVNYLTSPKERAKYEVEAYRCNMEMNHWRTGTMPDPKALAGLLKFYGIPDSGVLYATTSLRSAAKTIQAGGTVTEASKTAIEWWERVHPEAKL